jgi:hypothetical protein
MRSVRAPPRPERWSPRPSLSCRIWRRTDNHHLDWFCVHWPQQTRPSTRGALGETSPLFKVTWHPRLGSLSDLANVIVDRSTQPRLRRIGAPRRLRTTLRKSVELRGLDLFVLLQGLLRVEHGRMSGAEELRPRDRLAWLLVIGRRLREEYEAMAAPLPAPLACLLQQLEARGGPETTAEAEAHFGPTTKPPAGSGASSASSRDRISQ